MAVRLSLSTYAEDIAGSLAKRGDGQSAGRLLLSEETGTWSTCLQVVSLVYSLVTFCNHSISDKVSMFKVSSFRFSERRGRTVSVVLKSSHQALLTRMMTWRPTCPTSGAEKTRGSANSWYVWIFSFSKYLLTRFSLGFKSDCSQRVVSRWAMCL